MTSVLCPKLRTVLIRQSCQYGERRGFFGTISSSRKPKHCYHHCSFQDVQIRKFLVSGSCRDYHHYQQLSTVPLPQNILTTNKSSTKHKYFNQNEENKNVETYLRSAPGYRDTFFDPGRPLDKERFTKNGLHPAVQDFIQASLNPSNVETVTSPCHADIVNRVLTFLKTLSDIELLQILSHLRHFPPCDRADDPKYVRIWSTLDAECVARSGTWSLDFLFQAADVWSGLKLVRFSKFHRKFMLSCLHKCGNLKKEHFIRWMYCLNVTRSLPSPMAKYEIEEYLRNAVAVKSLSIQELTVVAMACFKTETALEDRKLFEEILDAVISERKTMDPISVAGVAKFARYCSNTRVKPVLFRFQEAFLPELERLGIQACTHLALIGTKSQSGYLPLINAVVKIIQENIGNARLKDLERICLVMTMFEADCQRLGDFIVEELAEPSPSRAAEMKEYGRCLPAILHYLSIKEIFSHDLMNYVLGEEFRRAYYGKTSEIYLRELLCLDFCAELEVKGYSGARLSEEVRDQIAKSHTARVGQLPVVGSKLSGYEKSLREAAKNLESFIGGSDYYLISNILPQHYCRKIVFCTDATGGKHVPIPNSYRSLAEHQIKYIDNRSYKDVRYHVMFTCNRNDYNFSDKKLTVSGRMIVRQLTKMGYNVHVVFPPFAVSEINYVLKSL